MLLSVDHFAGRRVVVTEKLDGENTSLYRDGLHARSTDYAPHWSRNWIRALHGRIRFDIPEGWRIIGENLYGLHSIAYYNLPTYFFVFAVVDEKDLSLSWDDVVEWCALLDLHPVPVLYDGPWDEERVKACYQKAPNGHCDEPEGYVVRVADAFPMEAFERSIAKFVRAGHVQTTKHWMFAPPVKNLLAREP